MVLPFSGMSTKARRNRAFCTGGNQLKSEKFSNLREARTLQFSASRLVHPNSRCSHGSLSPLTAEMFLAYVEQPLGPTPWTSKTQALRFSSPISKRFLEAWKRSGGGCDGSDG